MGMRPEYIKRFGLEDEVVDWDFEPYDAEPCYPCERRLGVHLQVFRIDDGQNCCLLFDHTRPAVQELIRLDRSGCPRSRLPAKGTIVHCNCLQLHTGGWVAVLLRESKNFNMSGVRCVVYRKHEWSQWYLLDAGARKGIFLHCSQLPKKMKLEVNDEVLCDLTESDVYASGLQVRAVREIWRKPPPLPEVLPGVWVRPQRALLRRFVPTHGPAALECFLCGHLMRQASYPSNCNPANCAKFCKSCLEKYRQTEKPYCPVCRNGFARAIADPPTQHAVAAFAVDEERREFHRVEAKLCRWIVDEEAEAWRRLVAQVARLAAMAPFILQHQPAPAEDL